MKVTSISVLANARHEYALGVFDPAPKPYDRFDTSGKRIIVFRAVAGMPLAITAVCLVILLKRAFASIRSILEIPKNDLTGETT